MNKENRSQHLGKFAGIQALSEISLGSLLHSFHVPLSGHFLSLNQALLMTLNMKPAATRRHAIEMSCGMALIVAVLKTLSPAGKKLLPMLAICTQGFLYAFGVGLGGINFVGVTLAATLLSLWAFIQPLLVAFILFGSPFFEGLKKLWLEISRIFSFPPEYAWHVMIGLVLFKVLICVGLCLWIYLASGQSEEKYLDFVARLKNKAPLKKTSPKGIWGDFLNPLFIFSFLVSLLLFYFSKKNIDLDILFYALRILAVAFVFFWLIRASPRRWSDSLVKKFPALKQALDQALEFKSRY